MTHRAWSSSISFNVLGSGWIIGSILEIALNNWLVLLVSIRPLTLLVFLHIGIVLIIKCEHLWRLIILVCGIWMQVLLHHLMLHIHVRAFFLLVLWLIKHVVVITIILLKLLTISSCIIALILKGWSLNMITVIVSVAKSFSCCMLHVLMGA